MWIHKRALWKRRYSAKETYNLKEPTNVSTPYEFTSMTSYVNCNVKSHAIPVLQCEFLCCNVNSCDAMWIHIQWPFTCTTRMVNSHAPFVWRDTKMTGLFCKRALRYSSKETYNLKEPTNRSTPYEFTCTIRRTESSMKETIFCKRDL